MAQRRTAIPAASEGMPQLLGVERRQPGLGRMYALGLWNPDSMSPSAWRERPVRRRASVGPRQAERSCGGALPHRYPPLSLSLRLYNGIASHKDGRQILDHRHRLTRWK